MNLIDKGNSGDVIVIGGGIIGVASAYYLAEQGYRVTVLEKNQLGCGASHGNAASYGNAGWLSHGFSIPMAAPGVPLQGLKWLFERDAPLRIKPRLDPALLRWLWQFGRACNQTQVEQAIPLLLAMGKKTIERLEALHQQHAVAVDFAYKGRISLFMDAKAYAAERDTARRLSRYGVTVEALTPQQIRERLPQVNPAVQYGLYCPHYAQVNPVKLLKTLVELAQKLGVTFMRDCQVLGFKTRHQRINQIITSQGDIQAHTVVLAGGAWSGQIAQQLGIHLPIQPAKGYSVTLARNPQDVDLPLLLAEKHIAVTPMGQWLRLTSHYELAGFDATLDSRRIDAIVQGAAQYFTLSHPVTRIQDWCGFRPATPDDLPLIGRSSRFDNVVIATGHGSLGMTNSLATAERVTQLIDGNSGASSDSQDSLGSLDVDWSLLNPERFAHTGGLCR
ncbi:FAD-dependent oxidoreductase [Ostreibacterium oceani]|uniref:FAD-dependent oxidoreductase n=1 Tax=Ostreibacterium oceani TaxID=2654998 RepID=A0A6N7ESN5_9GAMM|nr:FAD-dependent oxidoreductase [Ostreibacterium oceani]MPV85512.1 FAD-dependent oxidoreductase [Ostreibacterium oceani]